MVTIIPLRNSGILKVVMYGMHHGCPPPYDSESERFLGRFWVGTSQPRTLIWLQFYAKVSAGYRVLVPGRDGC